MIEELQAGTGALNDIMEKTVGRAADSQQLITEVGMDIERLSNHSDAVLEMSTPDRHPAKSRVRWPRRSPAPRQGAPRGEPGGGVRQRGGRRHHRPQGNRQ